jgi:hypothetical protein
MITSKLSTALIAAALTLAANAAEAQISCGAVITQDTFMGNDLSCPSHDPAFTVQGPATVDMTGHRVLGCKGAGVLVVGQGATVKNGAVQGCATGVHVAGKGGHTIVNLVASANGGSGFLVESGNNRIEKSAADYNQGNGFLLFSLTPFSGNSLVENVAFFNLGDGFNGGGKKGSYTSNIASQNEGAGFRMVGDDNVLLRNTAAANESDAFYVLGSDNRLFENVAADGQGTGFVIAGTTSVKNKLVGNLALGQGGAGFEIADGAVTSDNVAVSNQQDGIRVLGAGAMITDNASIGHFGFGIESSGGDSTVKGNRSFGNDVGITIGAAGGTSILSNLALGNPLDTEDQAPFCAGHTWSKNIFSSTENSCTKN